MKTIVSFGHTGDLLNILPVAWYWAEQSANLKVPILTAEEYADVLQAASYVKPLIWKGDPKALDSALKHFGLGFGQYIVTCPLRRGWRGNRSTVRAFNFSVAQWMNLGVQNLWNDLPLVLDQRDLEAEREVIEDLDTEPGHKYIVTSFSGIWSAFPPRVAALLSANLFRAGLPVIDISNYRAGRIDHMLGLLENASCLITIDSAILHLAYAVRPPTIALVSDRKWPHSASHPRQFWVGSIRYSEVEASINYIVEKAKELCK